ncbi:unnamed protein product [Mycena citricolor]|uniref:Uncharacterized protein n=1 Tax=Mycena citricolor TaxID=2018698 RepID=A0AAD2HFZ0_9AGAR|nr:unnamed protein product [Mycena citricolor]
MATSPGRRTHRKRLSLRLSADTTHTLPEYPDGNVASWRDLIPPPEYDSDADHADEEGTEGEEEVVDAGGNSYVPPTPVSPRLTAAARKHRRRASSPPQRPQDAFLDSLLERSVHALELSNAILQSSMTPSSSTFRDAQSSPTPSVPMPISRTLSRTRVEPRQEPSEEPWAANLAAIVKDVDELLVSSSLPATGSSPIAQRRPRRRPSLDHSRPSSIYSNAATTLSSPGLHMAPSSRIRLVSPAPRALTQFVVAGSEEEQQHITLPSTLGLRAAASDWHLEGGYDSVRSNSTVSELSGLPPRVHGGMGLGISGLPPTGFPMSMSSGAMPVVSTRIPEPSTPAYTMLSSFVSSPPKSSIRGRSRGSSSRSSSLGLSSRSHTPGPRVASPVPEESQEDGESPSSNLTVTPERPFLNHANLSASIIARLPSESPDSSPSSESESDCEGRVVDVKGKGKGKCRAREALSALRKILDEAPKPPPRPSRKFQPRSPPPSSTAAPSTATASVSRLFTKGGRHSVRQSEKVVSIMKKSGSIPGTPVEPEAGPSTLPTTTFWSLPNLSLPYLGSTFAGSKPESGASTPKRISFAELPESERWSSTGRAKKRPRRHSKSAKGKGRARDGSASDWGEEESSGWLSWLVGGATAAGGLAGGGMEDRERVSGRISPWSGGIGRTSGDDWAV